MSVSPSVERAASLLKSSSNDSVPAATRYIVPAARAARSAVRYLANFSILMCFFFCLVCVLYRVIRLITFLKLQVIAV